MPGGARPDETTRFEASTASPGPGELGGSSVPGTRDLVTFGRCGPAPLRYCEPMRINRAFLGWGVFLVLVGAVPLSVRGGYLTEDQLPDVVSLWPLILIGIGIGILLARTRYAFLGGLVIAATFGLMVGGALAGGVDGIRNVTCSPGSGATAFPTRDGSLTEASASIDLDLNCGSVTVALQPGDTWRIEGQDRDGTGPNIDADNDSLRVRSHDNGSFLDEFNDRETWRVSLPESVLLDLNLNLNAGSSSLDLGTAGIEAFELDLNAGSATVNLGSVRELGDLDIGLNAGSLEITLPNQSFTGSIEANAGSVELCVPPTAALRLHTEESIVASYDFEDRGLVKQGSTWETAGFDSAAVRIELDTRANAGSFSLNPEDGCRG